MYIVLDTLRRSLIAYAKVVLSDSWNIDHQNSENFGAISVIAYAKVVLSDSWNIDHQNSENSLSNICTTFVKQYLNVWQYRDRKSSVDERNTPSWYSLSLSAWDPFTCM